MLSGEFAAQNLTVPRVTLNAFQFLGVPPVLGRTFGPGDVTSAGEPEPVTVITFSLWQRLFGGDPNVLGRTLWDLPGGREGGARYLVLGFGSGEAVDLVPPRHDDLIAYGPLLSDDGAAWLGTVALVSALDSDAARGVLSVDRYAGVEVHQWEFGGRR